MNTYIEIQETLFRFMRSFDTKDWNEMSDCLADEIYCDYFSFLGEEPATIKRNDYINKRKVVLGELKTQHNLTNLSIVYTNDVAEVNCNFIIYRFHREFSGSKDQFFHSYGTYLFKLKRDINHWKINSITQALLVNDGNPQLHEAMRNK